MGILNSYPSRNHDLLYERLNLEPGMKILDVGGGGNAFKFADVVVDMDFNKDNSHRDGCDINLDISDQCFIQADIHDLPFHDKTFDFVICLHLLEHVEYPQIACKELIRVAKTGFIETPRKWIEFYAGHPTHKWLIDEYKGKMIFEPITFNNSPFLNCALPLLWDSEELQRKMVFEFANIPCVQILWKDSFQFEILEPLPEETKQKKFEAQRHYAFAKNLLYWIPDFKTGWFHAKTTEKMCPEVIKYKKLSGFYSILDGPIRDIFVQKIGIKFLILGLILRSFRWTYIKILRLYRKLLLKSIKKIEKEDEAIHQ